METFLFDASHLIVTIAACIILSLFFVIYRLQTRISDPFTHARLTRDSYKHRERPLYSVGQVYVVVIVVAVYLPIMLY